MVILWARAADPSFHALQGDIIKIQAESFWNDILWKYLQTLKGKGNVSYNYYYSEKSFVKWLNAWTFLFEKVSSVQPGWCCTNCFPFSLRTHFRGRLLWKMTWSVNVNDSKIFLRGILATYKPEAQLEFLILEANTPVQFHIRTFPLTYISKEA